MPNSRNLLLLCIFTDLRDWWQNFIYNNQLDAHEGFIAYHMNKVKPIDPETSMLHAVRDAYTP